MQRIIGLLLVVTVLVVACGGKSEESQGVPTLIPTLESSVGDSPRIPATSLPPTWTPGAAYAQPVQGAAPSAGTGGESTPVPEVATSANDEENVYVVEEGDTLAEIALRFEVDLDVLAEANGIEDIDHIETGQQLVIPR